MLDKEPFAINEFKGISLGSANVTFPVESQDAIDFNHALDALNIVFLKEGGFQTRPPFTQKLELVTDGDDTDNIIVQFWKIANLSGTYFDNRWFFLAYSAGSNVGKFYDTGGATPTVPVGTIDGCKYASVLNIYGRLYISPLADFGEPLTGPDGIIWLYDGVRFRQAGATAPVGATLALTDTAVVGANVTEGLHIGAIAFETDSGFITKAGPVTRIQVTVAAGGGRAVRFTNIDIGPTGTVARHLLLTKTISNYDGIQDNWELFFALRIADNTTVTADVVVPDTGLVNSADYLLSELAAIPACNALSVYGTHLMYNGPSTLPTVIYVSKGNDPETIDETEDYIQKKDGIPEAILNSRELRGLNYIFKETCTYVVREDVDNPPNAWAVDLVDSGIGIAPMAIGEVLANSGGLVLDNLIVGGMYGLYVFSGTYARVPFSYNIQAKFNGMTREQVKYTRMAVDPVRRRIYLLLGDPLSDTTELWMADYFNGLDNENIKWARWEAYDSDEGGGRINLPIRAVTVDPNNNGTDRPNVTFVAHSISSTRVGVVFEPDEELGFGDDVLLTAIFEIPWLYETGFTSSPLGYAYSFSYLGVRAAFRENSQQIAPHAGLTADIISFDDTTVLDSVIMDDLVLAPKKVYSRPLNGATAEMVRVKLYGYNTIYISHLVLFTNEKAKVRPR